MSNATNAVRQKVEAALKAYLTAVIAEGTPLKPVELKTRQEITDVKFPRLVLDALRSPEDPAVEGLYRVELDMHLGTKATETDGATTADVLHAQRVGQLTDLLGYGARATILAALNAPETGPDNRTVKGIEFYDLFVEEEAGDILERVWVERITYVVVCALRAE